MDFLLREEPFKQLTWQDFEKLILSLLQELGAASAQWTGPGPDAGVDIVAEVPLQDPLGLMSTYRLIVQCKHYANSGRAVSRRDLESLRYAIDRNRDEPSNLLCVTSTAVTRSAGEMISQLNDRNPLGSRVFVLDERRSCPSSVSVPVARCTVLPPGARAETDSLRGRLGGLRRRYETVREAQESGTPTKREMLLKSL